VVLLDEPQSISSAVLAGPANPQTCGPLSAERRKQNILEDVSFYEVKSDTAFGLAIGVIGNVSQPKVKDGIVLTDIGNDGNFERFTLCATSDGLVFHVWTSLPFKKDPVWSGYYYLGYDVDRTCP